MVSIAFEVGSFAIYGGEQSQNNNIDKKEAYKTTLLSRCAFGHGQNFAFVDVSSDVEKTAYAQSEYPVLDGDLLPTSLLG